MNDEQTLVKYRSIDKEYIRIIIGKKLKRKSLNQSNLFNAYAEIRNLKVYVNCEIEYIDNIIDLDNGKLSDLQSKLEELAKEKTDSNELIAAINKIIANYYEAEECSR